MKYKVWGVGLPSVGEVAWGQTLGEVSTAAASHRDEPPLLKHPRARLWAESTLILTPSLGLHARVMAILQRENQGLEKEGDVSEDTQRPGGSQA